MWRIGKKINFIAKFVIIFIRNPYKLTIYVQKNLRFNPNVRYGNLLFAGSSEFFLDKF